MDRELLLKSLRSYHPVSEIKPIPVKLRRAKLRDFRKHLAGAKNEIYAALVADLNRDMMETLTAEVLPLLQITSYLENNLVRLTRPRMLPSSLTTFPARTRLVPEPYGRVLVVSTWNYPLLLTLEPAIGAFAAGNQVVLKFSPRSPHTNEVIRKLLKSCFSSDEILVVGDELTLDEVADAFYDFIFVTGNRNTGKSIMRKAAENLTPCIMELGGKNPCIVASNACLPLAARRIVWGKFFNAGQSCAAPDYLFVQKDVKDRMINLISAEIRRMFGEHPLQNGGFTAMPDSQAYNRMIKLISGGRLLVGGDRNPQKLAIEPTVIDRLPDDSPLFTEEVFGPLLPVKEFSTEEELLRILGKEARPLAAYCFGGSEKLIHSLQNNYSCGALVFNDVLLHFTNMHIPFGGVGASGFGAYHGEKSFTAFSHDKPVMKQLKFIDLPFRYPPYRKFVRRILEFLNRLPG